MKTLPERLLRDVLIGIGIAIALLTAGCAAIPSVAGYFTSGGVTLYKSAKENGPKAEFVALKVQHDTYLIGPSPTCKLSGAPPLTK